MTNRTSQRIAVGSRWRGFSRSQRMFCAFMASLQLLLPSLVVALPTDGIVVGGSAEIQQISPTQLTIQQTTDRAILNWQSFSIGANETVRFDQPSINSIAMNSVTGIDPSVILGNLQANGRIFLLNPNGILFGAGAQINVGGLLATTLQIRDDDFMAGRFLFAQDPLKGLKSVVNQGTIHVSDHGFVVLAAPGVSNEGVIVASLGKVVLGSGQGLSVDLMGDGLIKYALSGKVLDYVMGVDGKPLSSAVSNTGMIQADGGHVILQAKASGDIFSSVVNQSGVIRARSLDNHGGTVQLLGGEEMLVAATAAGAMRPAGEVSGAVINTGMIDVAAGAPNAAQGSVTMVGERVGQFGSIVATGVEGTNGGEVVIASTTRTLLASGSTIDVSGSGHSSGGRLRVWSDQDTFFDAGAAILARGGELGGNGGFVELSGKENLGYAGSVNALAPFGSAGTLLLDPRNITIAAAGAAYNPGVNNLFGNTPAVDVTISAGSINAAAANVVLQANNDITVGSAINMANAGVGIAMQAGRDINVNAAITTNNGNISLTANDSSAIAANRLAGTGDIVFGVAGANLSAGTGNIDLTIGSSAAAPFNPGSITTVRNLTTTGNITLNSRNTVSLSGAVNAGSGIVSINANSDGAGAQGFTMNAGSSIATTNIGVNAVSINVNGAAGGTGAVSLRNITTGAGGTLAIATNVGGNMTGGAISQVAGTTLNVGTAALSIGSATADITLSQATNNFGTVSVSRARNVTLRDADALALGPSTISGNMAVTAGDSVTQTGALSSTGGASTLTVTTLNNAGAPITLTNPNNNFANINLSARNAANTANTGGAIAYRDLNGVNAAQIRTTSTVDLTAGGAITDSGTLVGSTLTARTLNNAGAAITLDTATNNFTTINLQSRNAADTADANGAIAYRDTDGFDVAAARTLNTVTLTGGGAITDSGTLTGSTLTATTLNNAGAAITLDTPTNNFTNVSLNARNAANTADTPGAITYADANGLNLNLARTAGTLRLTTGGALTQTGTITATGVRIDNTGPVTLNNAGNAITTFAANVTGAGNSLSFNESNGLTIGSVLGLNGVTTSNGALTVTSVTGGLTVANNVNAGTGSVTLNANGANQTLTTNAGTNVNGSGGVALVGDNMTLNGTVTAAGQTVTLRQFSNGRQINLGTKVAGQLGLTDAELDRVTATTLKIGNNASGNISNTAAISPANASTLSLETAGTITQTATGSLTVPTLIAKTRNNLGGAITLGNATNEVATIDLRARNAADTADANGAITYRDASGFDVAAVQTAGTLNLTASGTITDSGALLVGGTTTLTAGTNNITVDTTTNNFNTVVVASGNNVTLVDADALSLGASTVSGTLNVTTAGAITQTGAVAVTGVTTLVAGANDITLTNGGNNFTSVGITSGNNVSLTDGNALTLNASNVSGTFSANAGDVTVGGAVASTGGAVSLTASNSVTQSANLSAVGANNVTVTATTGSITMAPGATTTSGTGAINYTAGINVTLGSLTTGGAVNVLANGGSVLSAVGSGTNVTASAASTLQAFNGVVGAQAAPLTVNVNPGTLSIRATTAIAGISAFLTGTVLPSNALTLLNVPPGSVCFNGCPVPPSINPVGGFSGLIPSFSLSSAIPWYIRQPSDPPLISVVSTYLPETVVAEAKLDVKSDDRSVARGIPPCYPEWACKPGASVLTAPADGEDPELPTAK
jgi:trimeric autotransporter adhesin